MLMDIFEYKSYKTFIRDYVESLPSNGRGELTRLAQALSIHNTTLSQILKGQKNINQEQAIDLANYLNFNEEELDYLLLLINYERAGSYKLKNYYSAQVEKSAKKCISKITFEDSPHQKLSESVKSKFYSSWSYSGVRVSSSIPEFQTLEKLSHKMGLSRSKTKEILDFLISNGLCIKEKDKYKPGPSHTHIGPDDPFINIHRINWRTKAIEKLVCMESQELAFSAPMSLSEEDFLKLRSKINKLITEAINIAKKSSPEVTSCLNIDWFKF